MLFYITGGAPQAVPGTACVEANQTACTEVCCSSAISNTSRFDHLNEYFLSFTVPSKSYILYISTV
jgi:hypothetical protein